MELHWQGEIKRDRREACPSASLFATNATLIAPIVDAVLSAVRIVTCYVRMALLEGGKAQRGDRLNVWKPLGGSRVTACSCIKLIYYYLFRIKRLMLRSGFHFIGRNSSAGRASDWRSEGPWFNPGFRHVYFCINCFYIVGTRCHESTHRSKVWPNVSRLRFVRSVFNLHLSAGQLRHYGPKKGDFRQAVHLPVPRRKQHGN